MNTYKLYFLIGTVCLIIGLVVGLYYGRTQGIPFVKKETIKAIGIYSGKSPFELSPLPTVHNPVLTSHDVTDVAADYVTDPFVVKEGSSWFMFMGVRNTETQQGDIGLATSDDGIDWQYQQIVLDEPFHVSYPHVFKWQDEYYLVPESPEAYSIRLYKALDFPNKWTLVGTLLEGNLVDPTPFHFNEMWWMLAESNPRGNDRLSLFYSQDLTGPWVEHPMSPIINGNGHIARPGGRVLILDDRIIRFAQDDEPYYGNKVWAFEITHLSPVRYQEELLGDGPILQNGEMGWNNKGMFYLNPHPIAQESWIAYVGGHGESLAFGSNY